MNSIETTSLYNHNYHNEFLDYNDDKCKICHRIRDW